MMRDVGDVGNERRDGRHAGEGGERVARRTPTRPRTRSDRLSTTKGKYERGKEIGTTDGQTDESDKTDRTEQIVFTGQIERPDRET